MKIYKPQDSTTNPSLLFDAAKKDEYQKLVESAIEYGAKKGKDDTERLEWALDKLAVKFGCEILKIVPGRVSTELDAHLSNQVEANIRRARRIIKLYEEEGIPKERILIKIASTWEGIQAAKKLEEEGIHCNLTLIFSMVQAIACAEAKVTLISPFAGRITDWYKAKEEVSSYPPATDPGIVSVKKIYNYFKHYGYKTVVMGASFRTKEQVIELAGCDLLTVSPQLLGELASSTTPVPKILDAHKTEAVERIPCDEESFKKEMLKETDEMRMASSKLQEGIKKFGDDLDLLANIIKPKIAECLKKDKK